MSHSLCNTKRPGRTNRYGIAPAGNRPVRIAVSIILLIFLGLAGCGPSANTTAPSALPDGSGAASKNLETAKTTVGPQEEGAAEEQAMKISVKSADNEVIYALNGSRAAKELYAQLPLTVETEPFGSNEIIFYPKKLSTQDTPLSGGEAGSLSYYEPWGNVVMFYASFNPNDNLYELGAVVRGEENIQGLSGTITVSAYD